MESLILETGAVEMETLRVLDGILARGSVGGGVVMVAAGVSGIVIGVRQRDGDREIEKWEISVLAHVSMRALGKCNCSSIAHSVSFLFCNSV